MRNIRFYLTLGLLLLVTTIASAFDADDLSTITVTNGTKKDFQYLFVSPGDSNHWGPDLLGSLGTLSKGDSLSFYLYNSENSEKYDIMAVDTDGNSFEFNVQVRMGKEAVVKMTAKQAAGTFDAPFQEISISNETEYTLDYLFFSPEDSEVWGADLLGDETRLAPGESHTFLVPLTEDEAQATYNIMAVDEDSDTYSVDVTPDDSGETQYVTLDISLLDTAD